MYLFLSFMFGEAQLNGWFPEQWALLYDHQYVSSVLVGGLKKFVDSVRMVLLELKPAMQAQAQEKSAVDKDYKLAVAHVAVDKKPLTTFKPFAFYHSKRVKEKKT